jgi:hypothetical protein
MIGSTLGERISNSVKLTHDIDKTRQIEIRTPSNEPVSRRGPPEYENFPGYGGQLGS